MRRRRFQKGSLQLVRQGKGKRWVVLYYDPEGQRRYKTLGAGSMTKGDADKKRAEFMREVNGSGQDDGGDVLYAVLLSEFVEQVYLPFHRGKWKASTAITTENRIQNHIVKDLGHAPVGSLSLRALQDFLECKAAANLSYSLVNHLRWDLSSIFEMALAEQAIDVDPCAKLFTPKCSIESKSRAMTANEVGRALGAVGQREKLIMQLAVFAGFRPGEILALQRRHVGPEGESISVEQRIYAGKIDRPKNGKHRLVGVPPRTAALLREWLDTAVGVEATSWLFASEGRQTPLWLGHVLTRHIQGPLKKIGLGWVDFRVMRRTNASLGHDAEVDPKVSADQRGHGIGVSLDVYTASSVTKKVEAMKKLEESVLGHMIETRAQKLLES